MVVLVRELSDESALCIGQASHAWVSGQIARAWAWPIDRPADAGLAAEQHDVGMAEWDLRPTLHRETGWPTPFAAMPRTLHTALWDAAPQRLLSASTYAALAVSLHGTGLYERYPPKDPSPAEAAAVTAYLDSQRALQEELSAAVGADAEERERLRALLRCWDGLSLELCLGWSPTTYDVPGPDGTGASVTLGSRDDDAWTLEPWPLGPDAIDLVCEGRVLAERYDDEAGLHAALAAAEPRPLGFALRRGADANAALRPPRSAVDRGPGPRR